MVAMVLVVVAVLGGGFFFFFSLAADYGRGCYRWSGGGGGCGWLESFCGGYFLFYFNEFFILL